MPTLQFKGKTFVQNQHHAVKYHQLVPKKDLSLTDKISLHDNLNYTWRQFKSIKSIAAYLCGKNKVYFHAAHLILAFDQE